MEEIVLLVLVILFFLVVGLAGAVLAIVAMARTRRLRQDLRNLVERLWAVERRLTGSQAPTPGAPAPGTAPAGEEASRVAPAASAAGETPVPVSESAAVPPPIPGVPAVTADRSGPPQPLGHLPPLLRPTPPSGESFESRIGKKWMTWAGSVVLLLGVVFFLKYAFDSGWIGHNARVFLCALGGMLAIAGGIFCLEKRWRVLGQGLIGLGLGVLYATFYSACSIYDPKVMGNTVAFGLMILVTAMGVAMAVRYNALTLAMLAALGGLLTPVLVSTGENHREALFAYLLMLDLGVLAVALWRNFRALDALALLGTIVLYSGWYVEHYTAQQLAPAMLWLTALYLLFLIEPFVYNLVTRTAVPIERFVMALVNAAFFMIMAWQMLYNDGHKHTLGFISLGMAGAYLIVGTLLRRRVAGDVRSLLASVAMAITFLTLAVPLHLRMHGIMLAWVAEAPVLLFLGYRYRYQPARILAAVVLGIGIIKLVGWHWPTHEGPFAMLVNRAFLSAVMVPLAMGVFALVGWMYRRTATAADRTTETVTALAGGILAMLLLHSELWQWMDREVSGYGATCLVVVLWTAGSWVYRWAATRTDRQAVLWTMLGAVGVAAILCVAAYAYPRFHQQRLLLNVRLAIGLAVVVTAFLHARFVATGAADFRAILGKRCLWLAVAGLLVLLSGEVWAYCQNSLDDSARADRAGQMAMTLVWGLFALGMLFVGFARRVRPVRLAALGLFAMAALKLVLVDMMHVKDVYRILSFLGLGLLLIGSAYLYHKLEKRLAPAVQEDQQESTQ